MARHSLHTPAFLRALVETERSTAFGEYHDIEMIPNDHTVTATPPTGSNTAPPSSSSPTEKTSTPTPKASGLASKFKPKKQPRLQDIKLSHILNGETCPPISFTDFASYLSKREMTEENLLFVVWYRSYMSRWHQLDQGLRDKVPIPRIDLGNRHDPFGDRQRFLQLPREIIGGGGEEDTGGLQPREQPMREEADRALRTFLTSEGSKELNCSDELRQFVETCLKRSTAPEVFQPIYEEMYTVLETQSLAKFIELSRFNVNWKKQAFWYFLGIFDLSCGIILYIILTLLLHPVHFSYRAIRLPSGIFIWFGSGSLYSGYRGFCSHVWGRSSTQIKPWELDGYERFRRNDVSPPTADAVSSGSRPSPSPGVRGPSSGSGHPDDAVARKRVEVKQKRRSGRNSKIKAKRGAVGMESTESFGFMGDGQPMRMSTYADNGHHDLANTTLGSHPSGLGPVIDITRDDDDDEDHHGQVDEDDGDRQDESCAPMSCDPGRGAALAPWEILDLPTLGPPPPLREPPQIPPKTLGSTHSGPSPQHLIVSRSQPFVRPRQTHADGDMEEIELQETSRPLSSLGAHCSSSNHLHSLTPPSLHFHAAATSNTALRTGPGLGDGDGGDDGDGGGLVPTAPGTHGHEVGQDHIKMFGPEQVVEDPILRAYYESIIMDILVCMIICTSAWIALCLAVPLRGLG